MDALIWLERNARSFNRLSRTAVQLKDIIAEEISVWVQAGFSSLFPLRQQGANVDLGRQFHDM